MKNKIIQLLAIIGVAIITLVVCVVALKGPQAPGQTVKVETLQSDDFNIKGLDSAMILPGMENLVYEELKSTEIAYKVKELNNVYLSRMYMIDCEGSYQFRFRITCKNAPEGSEDLFSDTGWQITGADGKDYTGCIGGVHTKVIDGMDCVEAVIELDSEEYAALRGKILQLLIVCTGDTDYLNIEKSYAHGKLEIPIP